MSNNRGIETAPKKQLIAMGGGGTRLPKETSGGGGKGSGKPTKPKDVKLPGERFTF